MSFINPSAAFLDGYLFLSRSGTYEIYNSATEGYNSWNPLDYISANQYPDPVIAIGKQNNLLVAFGTGESTHHLVKNTREKNIRVLEVNIPK